jgi:hypothetical protein
VAPSSLGSGGPGIYDWKAKTGKHVRFRDLRRTAVSLKRDRLCSSMIQLRSLHWKWREARLPLPNLAAGCCVTLDAATDEEHQRH